MLSFKTTDFNQKFFNDDACLEWLTAQLYPDGITCPICKKVTKHHRASKRRCYVCDICGNHLYPTAGTIFRKSTTPLKTWFKIIYEMQRKNNVISVKKIQRENDLSYNTACRIVKKIKEFLKENRPISTTRVNTGQANVRAAKNNIVDIGERLTTKVAAKAKISGLESPKQNYFGGKQFYWKRDRTTRLLKTQMLLCRHPQGLTINEIASKFNISKRTIYRDLRALEYELEVPLWEERSKRGIIEGFSLPPIIISPSEATLIFLATRLIQNFGYLNNPDIILELSRLNTFVPQPLEKEIRIALEFITKHFRNEREVSNFRILTRAWLLRKKVKTCCQYIDEDEPAERIIAPYFIDSSKMGGSIYVIAYCYSREIIGAFKLERIIGDVITQPGVFKIPDDFNPMDYMGSIWDLQTENETQTVKLHFKPDASIIATEYNLFPIQLCEFQNDGSMIMTIKVHNDVYFRKWLLTSFDEVEVLEPETLRSQMVDLVRSIMNIYSSSLIP